MTGKGIGARHAASRETTVLLAGIVADAQAGAGGVQADVARLAETLAHAALVSGGRVTGRRERDVTALFPSPDAAVSAALRMHAYALTLPPMAASRGMRMGLHCGPVGQRGNGIAGRAVYLALELLEGAVAGEALISGDAVARLSPGIRRLVGSAAAGRTGRLLLGDLVFRREAELFAQRAQRMRLRLAYRSKSIVQRREGDAATIGSDAACDLPVEGGGASRRHCTISRREGACLLRDHSDKGTFVTIEGGAELVVRGEEIALSGTGVISFGRPGAGSRDVVQYSCER